MQKKPVINKLLLARMLMIGAIMLIVAFQAYWIRRLYREKKASVKREAAGIFRDVIYNLQVARFKADTLFVRAAGKPSLFAFNAVNAMRREVSELNKNAHLKKKIELDTGMMFIVNDKHHGDTSRAGIHRLNFRGNEMPPELDAMIKNRRSGDTAGIHVIVRSGDKQRDSIRFRQRVMVPLSAPAPRPPVTVQLQGKPKRNAPQVDVRFDARHPEKPLVRLMIDDKTINDTIPVYKIDSAFKKELAKANITLPFSIRTGKDDSLRQKDTLPPDVFRTRLEFVGFVKPNWYQAVFDDPTTLVTKRLAPQILFSAFLIAFTSVTFIFLYRNLAAQRRLTEMKNDFISNITHELKTPIATVSVAVEALRNFGGIQSPERTKEYLDISAAELQRLGLLADKVLKLSLFENRELELKKEAVDLKQLTEEVLSTMKLQFEKHHAKLNLEVQGFYFTINADRLHITSVIYNLLDNAIKYSRQNPEITVCLRHETDAVLLEVSDKGIGIPADFRNKIFEKFFRVPTGDHHNIKGYGLGLSYVSHIVKKHDGSIAVESEPGKGSTFTVKFPVA